MSGSLTVTILGCGASGGVPLIGCPCPTCSSPDPKNKRTRASVLVEVEGQKLLIDTGPDLRQQALREGLTTVDAILYTHAHADHCHGIDDARSFNYYANKSIQIFGNKETLEEIKQRFSYAFHPAPQGKIWLRPSLEPQEIQDYDRIQIGKVEILTFLQHYGKQKSSGYRIGKFAYSTDVDNIPEQSSQLLEKLDVWVVDCLRYERSPTHAFLEQTLGWIERFKPKLAVLTHMAHELEYETLRAQLPAGVIPAYDGMKIELGAAESDSIYNLNLP